MLSKSLLCVLVVSSIFVSTAYSGSLFSDAFNSNLDNWNQQAINGATIQLVSHGSGQAVQLSTGTAEGIRARLVSEQLNMGPGRYDVAFDFYYDIRDLNDGRRAEVDLPGGLSFAPKGWNNGIIVRFLYQDIAEITGHYQQWAYYQVAFDSSGSNLTVYRNGQLLINMPLPAQPDYAGWNEFRATLINDYAGAEIRLDNVSVQFTPESPSWGGVPVDQSRYVTRFSPRLSWAVNPFAQSYNLYFAPVGQPLQLIAQTSDTRYTGLPLLDDNQNYQWRVDPVYASSTATGSVWSFRTTSFQLGLDVSDNGTLLYKNVPYQAVGVNHPFVFRDVLADPCDLSYHQEFAVLNQYNIPFARILGSTMLASYSDLYITDKDLYFELYENVIASAEANNVGIIPSLFWAFWSLPDLLGEDFVDLADPYSKCQRYMRSYIYDVVTHFADSPAIWAWEMGNEWNMHLDSPTVVQPVSQFFGQQVRRYDPYRVIETGNYCPRQGGGIVADCPDPINVADIHLYESYDIGKMGEYVTAADSGNLPLFVGEWGTTALEGEELFNQRFNIIKQNDIPLSAVWGYEFSDTEWLFNATVRPYVLEALRDYNDELNQAAAAICAQTAFCDDFETDLSQWQIDTYGTANAYLTPLPDTTKALRIDQGNSNAYLYSRQSFAQAAYRFTFDLYYDVRDYNDGRVQVQLAGGFAVGLKGWNNGTIIFNRGQQVDTIFGGHWSQWANYRIEQNGALVTVWRNNQIIYADTLALSPDFATYPNVKISARYDHSAANVRVDNMLLEVLDYQPIVSDFDCSYKVDLNDFAILSSQWLATPFMPDQNYLTPDLSDDGIVDLVDLTIFSSSWLDSAE